MEGSREERSAEQAASLFASPQAESQRRICERGKRRNCKIITGVCLLTLSLSRMKKNTLVVLLLA